jgi:hypothetical protein
LHILSWSINKHSYQRQFLFLIGRFLKISPLKLLGQMNQNLVGSISSIKMAHFVPILWQTWLPQTILVFDWLISKKYSPLKPLGQMNWNLVGSIYGRSSIKMAYFGPIHKQTWLPQAILVSDWSISKNLLLWNRLAKWTVTC